MFSTIYFLIMMKKNIVFILALLIAVQFQSQVVLIPPVLNEFYITPGSVSNAQITSVNGGELVRLTAQLTDQRSGEMLLEVTTQPFILNAGLNRPGGLGIDLQTQYGSGPDAAYIKTHRKLPEGSFVLCVQLVSELGLELFAKDCQQIEATSMMVLNLISPAHSDTVDTNFPMLTWLSSGHTVQSGDKSFKMTLVELSEGQNVDQALLENTPLLFIPDLKSKTVLYPSSAEPLLPGHTYGWTVEYWDEDRMVLSAEHWTFTIRENKPPAVFKYVKLQKEASGDVYPVIDGRIYFAMENAYSLDELQIRVINTRGEEMELKDGKSALSVGEGESEAGATQFELDLKDFNLPKDNYTMTVQTPRKRKYELQFNTK